MKNIRKITALVLSVLMVLSVMPVALAKDVSYTQDCPYIYIHGFAANTIYEDPSDPNSKSVFPPENDVIMENVQKAIPAFALYAVNKDGKMLADTLTPICLDLLGPAFLNENGERPEGNKTGVRFTYPPKSSIRKNSKLEFGYDWRLDPMVVAAQLNDYIEYVCDASGCDQVTIMAHSFGGIVTLAYATVYGTSRLKGVMMNSTAIYGETYNGELMTGDLKLSMAAVEAFMKYALPDSDYDTIIDGVFKIFDKAGLSNFLERYGNQIIADAGEEIMSNVILPMFIQWPSVWAMTPDEYLEDANEFIFNGNLIDKTKDYSVLKSKIAAYDTIVRASKKEKLVEMESEMNFGVLARYGFTTVPITSSWDVMSDGIVDTKNASFGATTATYGKTLPADYLAGVDAKYVSPDKTVDASTCLFPEKTWFVKNFIHTHSQLLPELTMAVLYADEEVTCDTYEAYPRFMIYADEEFTPQEKDDTLNPFQTLARFIRQIINLIKLAFEKLFK